MSCGLGPYLLTGKVFHQFLVSIPVHGFYKVIRNGFVGAGPLHIGTVHRGADHVYGNGLGKGGNKFVVFFQKLPAIHDGHIDIEKDHIGQGIGIGRQQLPEIVDGFFAIVKRMDLLGQTGRFQYYPGGVLVDIIVIDQTNDMFLFHIGHGSSNKLYFKERKAGDIGNVYKYRRLSNKLQP